jgi:hypothetical protein
MQAISIERSLNSIQHPAVPARIPAVRTPGNVAQPQPRYDIYAGIHKALRNFMADTLVRIGRMDTGDTTHTADALEQLKTLLWLCDIHLEDENRFVHPALERALPGSAEKIAGEHIGHGGHIEALRERIALVEQRAGVERAAAAHQLYHALALFVAENLEHMHEEETRHNHVLWASCTDAELLGIEQAIVASIQPEAMEACLRWMLPALNHTDRVGMLTGMRDNAPAEAYAGVLTMTRALLEPRQWDKLAAQLNVPAELR